MKKTMSILTGALFLLPLADLQAQSRHLLHYDFNRPLVAGRVENRVAANDIYDRSGVVRTPGEVLLGVFNNINGVMSGSGGAVSTTNGGFGTVTSFTVSMWYNTDHPDGLSHNARLFDTQLGGALFALADPGVDPGALQVYTGMPGAEYGGALIQEPHHIYSLSRKASHGLYSLEVGGVRRKWVFAAVTYDGSKQGRGRISLYAGSRTEPVILIDTIESSVLAGQLPLRDISFGGTSRGDRCFQGQIDDVHVFTAYSGSPDGALSQEQLDVIRLQGEAQLPQQEKLYLHYDFNQPLSGGKVANLAANNDPGMNRSGTTTVPGMVVDGVFDNTGSTMGATAQGGAVYPITQGFGTLTSFTTSFWYKTNFSSGLSKNARLFDSHLGGKLFVLADPGGATGALQVYSGATGVLIQKTHPIYSGSTGGVNGKWVFVAVSYDGSVGGKGTIELYAGSRTEPVTLIDSVDTTGLSGQISLDRVSFGGASDGIRPFSGWLDDIRISTAYSGRSEGALLLERLEEIRLQGEAQLP